MGELWVWVAMPMVSEEETITIGTSEFPITGVLDGWSWVRLPAGLVPAFLVSHPGGQVYAEPIPTPPAPVGTPGPWVVQLDAPYAALPAATQARLDAGTMEVLSAQMRILIEPGPAEPAYPGVRKLGSIPAEARVPSWLRSGSVPAQVQALLREETRLFRVVAAPGRVGMVTALVQGTTGAVWLSKDVDGVIATMTGATALALAEHPVVRRVEPFRLAKAASQRAARAIGLPPPSNAALATVLGVGEDVALIDTGFGHGTVPGPAAFPALDNRVGNVVTLPIPDYLDALIESRAEDKAPADGPMANGGESVGHGTHMVGIIAGTPTPGDNVGIAPRARVHVFAAGHRVHWKSFSSGSGWPEPDYGLYGLGTGADLAHHLNDALVAAPIVLLAFVLQDDEEPEYGPAAAVDEVCRAHPEALIVLAAGNFGRAESWKGGPGSVVAPGTAKNGITVGATENLHAGLVCRPLGRDPQVVPAWRADPGAVRTFGYRATQDAGDFADDPRQVAPWSGRGPVFGRLKPDVVAPGNGVLAARSPAIRAGELNEADGPDRADYAWGSGTSCAAAVVAGAAAVLRGVVRGRLGVDPTGALLKALFVASAEPDLPGRGLPRYPDGVAGFGAVRVDGLLNPATVVTLLDAQAVGFGAPKSYTLTAHEAEVRIALVWMDPPGEGIVNPLQLVFDAGGAEIYGSGDASGNVRDNAQRVLAPLPAGTTVTIEVRARAALAPDGFGIPQQTFALVSIGGTLT